MAKEIRLIKALSSKEKLTTKEKLKIAMRVLEIYGSTDLWFYEGGHPNIPHPLHNVFGLQPAQEGWDLAQKAINRLS